MKLRVNNHSPLFILYTSKFGGPATYVLGPKFHYITGSAICQEKNPTKIHKIIIPKLSILTIDFYAPLCYYIIVPRERVQIKSLKKIKKFLTNRFPCDIIKKKTAPHFPSSKSSRNSKKVLDKPHFMCYNEYVKDRVLTNKIRVATYRHRKELIL